MIRVCFLALLLLPLGGADRVGPQLHSYNDLREWPSVFPKCMPICHFKIDPHYVNDDAFCRRHGYSSAPCFVLNHDDPKLSDGPRYSTANDFVEAIATLPPRSAVALCFKFTGDPCLSPAFLKVADDFMAKATAAAMAHGVELVLDGVATPADLRTCMRHRWMPWNATWILSPWEALNSDSHTLGYDRFQVLNMKCCSDLEKVEAQNFGKFLTRPEDFQIWEPSDEATIRNMTNTFLLSDPAREHNKVLRFAINPDPVQLQRYVTATNMDPPIVNKRTVGLPDGDVLVQDGGGWVWWKTGQPTRFVGNITYACAEAGKPGDVYAAAEDMLMTPTANVSAGGRVVGLQCDQGVVVLTWNGRLTVSQWDGQKLSPVTTVQATDVDSAVWINGTVLHSSHGVVYANGVQRIGVGRSLRVWVKRGQFVLTATDGYCFHSETYNKRPSPLMCDQVPVPQPNTMSYTIGNATALQAQLREPSLPYPTLLHACNPELLHGTFGSGRDPFPLDQLTTIRFTGISDTTECTNVCGCPIPYNGMQHFDLPPYLRR